VERVLNIFGMTIIRGPGEFSFNLSLEHGLLLHFLDQVVNGCI
jgi:hypothetical protein